jgi:hypothetical protein
LGWFGGEHGDSRFRKISSRAKPQIPTSTTSAAQQAHSVSSGARCKLLSPLMLEVADSVDHGWVKWTWMAVALNCHHPIPEMETLADRIGWCMCVAGQNKAKVFQTRQALKMGCAQGRWLFEIHTLRLQLAKWQNGQGPEMGQ